MNKKEVFEVLKIIKTYWDNFVIDQDKIDGWHKILIDYDFDSVVETLNQYIKTNRFAPTVADLIKAPERRDRAVLNQEETKAMLQQWELDKENVATKEEIERHLAKMREVLGIQKCQHWKNERGD